MSAIPPPPPLNTSTPPPPPVPSFTAQGIAVAPYGPPPPAPPIGLPFPKPTVVKGTNNNGTQPPAPQSQIPIIKGPRKPFTTKIDWEEITSVNSTGSGAVFIIEVGNLTVVAKGSSTVVQDLFAWKILEKLKIKSTKYFVIQFADGRNFYGIQSNAFARANDTVKPRVKKELNRPFILVMEYVEGYDLCSIGSHPEALLKLTEHKALFEMGRMIGFDCLLNNWDRTPLIWDHDGNPGNFMFTFRNGNLEVYSIDQSITSVSSKLEKNYRAYLEKVENVVQNLTSNDWNSPKAPLQSIKQFIQMCTGIELNEIQLLSIREGILTCFNQISQTLDEESVTKCKDSLKQYCSVDWENVFTNGMAAVDTTFVNDVIKIFNANYEKIYKAIENSKFRKVELKYGMNEIETVKQTGGHSKEFIKVTTMQNSGASASSIEEFLQNEKGPRSDIILLHEYWMPQKFNRQIPLEEQPYFQRFINIAKKYEVYLVLGTGVEVHSEHHYCTSLFIGPNGIIGQYRKRKPIMRHISPGNSLGVWDTPLGRISIQICFDIENADIWQENIQLRPDIILNPVMIAGTADSSNWHIAIDEMAHKFEALCREHNCSIFRCDSSFTLGSSQSLTPTATITTRNSTENIFSVLVPKTRGYEQSIYSNFDPTAAGFGFEDLCIPPPRPRTEKRDNTGSRYLVRPLSGHRANTVHCSLNKTGTYAVTSDEHDVIKVWQTASARWSYDVKPDRHVTAVCCYNDYVITSSKNGKSLHWNINDGYTKSEFQLPTFAHSFAHFNETLLAALDSGEIVLIDTKDSAFTISNPFTYKLDKPAKFLSFIDANIIISASIDGLVTSHDIRKPNEPLSQFQFGSAITGLATLPNQQIIISTNTNVIYRVSSPESLSEHATCTPQEENVHTTSLTTITNQANSNSWIVSGATDGRIRLIPANFENNTSKVVAHYFDYHSTPVSSLFTNGTKLLSLSGQDAVIWHYKQNRNFIDWSLCFSK